MKIKIKIKTFKTFVKKLLKRIGFHKKSNYEKFDSKVSKQSPRGARGSGRI